MAESIKVQRVTKVSSLTQPANSSHHHQMHKNKLKRRARTIPVLHATVRSPSTNTRSTDLKTNACKDNLLSFSTILSTRQQNSFAVHSLNQSWNNLRPSQHRRSASDSQVNDCHNSTKQNDISTSIHANHQQRVDREQSAVKTCSPRTNEIIYCKANRSLNTNEYPTILDETKKQKKRRWSCSTSCVALVALLICFILAVAIAATIVGVLIKSKTTTTTTTTTPIITTTISTTLTTTAIIPTICSCLCSDKTWTFSSDILARWSFDGTFDDTMKIYNATPIQTPTFVSDGYVNQALFFTATATQSLSAPYIPLAYTSFTIEAWLKPTSFPNLVDHSILGLCPSPSAHLCLYLVIRTIASNHYLYFGFFGDDCQGNTSLTANQWIHAAFVFDLSTLTQSIYLNGLLDNKCIASAPFMASTGSVTIGTVPGIIPINYVNFFQGYIDHVTVTKRAKSSCEIHEDATLAACFLFDATAPYTDSGPNSLLSNEMSTAIIPSGHSLEAISFNGTFTSYFQALSFTALGSSSTPFSIILWIRPRSILTATIAHVSQNSLGTGWCVPFFGIAINGSIVTQTFNAGTQSIWGPSLPLSPIWSHVVETWSQTNGLRLYLNGILVASNASFVLYAASGVSDVVILGNSLSGYHYCAGVDPSTLAPGPFNGDIDDFRVYSRELTAAEINTIYTS